MTREQAIEILQNNQHTSPSWEAIGMAIEALKQPKIVRCKNCRYWLPMNRFHQDYHPGRGECELNCWVRDEDWFCGDGEPKDGEHNG